MGIEQCVYRLLGCPDFTTVGSVAVQLQPGAETPWIHFGIEETKEAEREKTGKAAPDSGDGDLNSRGGNSSSAAITKKQPEEKQSGRRPQILFKGPCNLSAIESYLSGGELVTEFNYVNEQGFITTGQNHSMHIWESAVCSKQQIKEALEEAPFLTEGDFRTSLFRKEYHIICYSLLPDCHAGLYRNKQTGFCISFGSRNFDLTDSKNWTGYMNGTIVNHLFPFTQEVLEQFAANWEFVGATSEEALVRNLDYIYRNVPGKPLILLFLGSEIEYEGVNEEFACHAAVHKRINACVRKFAEDKDRIKLVEMTNFIKSQADYEDSINHFARNVYYDLATEVCSQINDWTDRKIGKPGGQE